MKWRDCNFVIVMGILLLMIMVSVSLGLIFLVFFFVGYKKGQFDDDESPAVRMLKASKNNTKIRILTSTYLNITQPQALYLLKSEIRENLEIRIYNNKSKS